MIMMRKCRTSFCISQRDTSEGMTQNNVSPIFRYPERVLRMDAERQTYLAGLSHAVECQAKVTGLQLCVNM